MNVSWQRTSRALLIVGLSGSVVVAAACSQGQAEEAPTVATAGVELTDLRITAEATGSIEPIRTIEVKSKASGEILRLLVDTGDRVDPGTLLAEVDPRDVRNAYNQAEADLDVAVARVEISEAQLQRSEELLAAEVITQQEYEGTNLEYANAKAALVKGQTNLELARLRLGDVTIRAPLAGTIIAKSVEEGQVIQSASGNVSGGTTLFMMADLDEMQVRTLVDETDVGQLRPGLEATVRVEAFPDRTFTGQILKIEPQAIVQQNVTMFPVIVRLSNRSGLLKPGMNAEVEVLIAERLGVLTVPNGSVVEVQQAAPAAMVLGLDPNDLNLGRGGAGGRPGGAEGGARQNAAAPQGAEGAAGGAGGQRARRPNGASGAGGARRGALSEEQRGQMQAIRGRVESGEITQDSARILFQSVAGGPEGAAVAGDGEGTVPGEGERTGRPAVVFVVLAEGGFEARRVVLGLGDWDRTEIMSGLEQGEEVALIGAAQLQAQQAEFLNRIRERNGGNPFGGGGGPRR